MSGLFDCAFVSADLRADEEVRDVRSSVIGRILEQAIDRREADVAVGYLDQGRVQQVRCVESRRGHRTLLPAGRTPPM
jgi:hypothetical protein